MTKQPIIDELHETRRKMLDDANGSIVQLVKSLREQQDKSQRTIRKSSCDGKSDRRDAG